MFFHSLITVLGQIAFTSTYWCIRSEQRIERTQDNELIRNPERIDQRD